MTDIQTTRKRIAGSVEKIAFYVAMATVFVFSPMLLGGAIVVFAHLQNFMRVPIGAKPLPYSPWVGLANEVLDGFFPFFVLAFIMNVVLFTLSDWLKRS